MTPTPDAFALWLERSRVCHCAYMDPIECEADTFDCAVEDVDDACECDCHDIYEEAE